MTHFQIKTKTLLLTALLFFTNGIIGGCAVKGNSVETAAQKSGIEKKLTASLDQNSPKNKTINAVVIRKNELLSISLKDKEENKVLSSGGIFSHPIISPNKDKVAYLKDNFLYITNTNLEHIKIGDSISEHSFSWLDNERLLYSPSSGGLYIYDISNKSSIPYLQNEFTYKNITVDSKGKLYAEQYKNYKKDNQDYMSDYGVLFFDPATKEQKIIIPSIPSKIDTDGDLGMYPVITGMSSDDKYLYIWKHPHAGSAAADGMDLAVYDTVNGKFIEYKEPNIIALGHKDTLSPNPKDSRYLALIYGGDRMMGVTKDLAILDVVSGKLEVLSPKGTASMTPSYLSDGKTIIYASSEAQKDNTASLGDWLKNGKHFLYSIDTSTKEIKQLTNNPNYFDFAPKPIGENSVVFFRSDKDENVSLWKLENGKETELVDGVIFYTPSEFTMQHFYGHFYNEEFSDIK